MSDLEIRVRIMRQCQERLGLPYLPGGPEGSTLVLLGMLPFLQGSLRHSVRGIICETSAGWTIPSIKVDPIGFALAANPLYIPANGLRPLTANRDVQGPMSVATWNLFHIVLGPQCLKLLAETCALNGINGLRPFAGDRTLHHRVRQQAFHVFLEPRRLISPLPEMAGLSIEGRQLLSSVRPILIICNNWESPIIHRRTSTIRQETNDHGEQTTSIPFGVSEEGRLHLIAEVEEEEDRDRALIAQARRRDSCRNKRPGGRAPAETFSALPPLRGLTESQLAIMREHARSRFEAEPAALALALADVCAVCDDDFGNLRVAPAEDGYLLWTPCPLLTSNRPDVDLHIQVADGFYRLIPTDLARALQRAIESNGLAGLLAARNSWLDAHLSTSAAKVRCALRFQVPVWDGMPWSYYDLGLVSVRYDENGRPQMPGYRHYLTWRQQEYADWLAEALACRGWKIEATHALELPACGSSHTPSLHVVRAMAECLNSLVAAANHAVRSSMSLGETVSLVNSISALARLFECFFTFARNYPAAAPEVIDAGGRLVILERLTFRQEKIRFRPLAYSACLVGMLEDVAVAYHGLCGSLEARGYSLDPKSAAADWRSSAYGFIDSGFTGHTLHLIQPRKAVIRAGLLHHPASERFGTIDQNCMRNLTYFLLAATPKHQFAVMALCDHFPGGTAGTLSRDNGAAIYSLEIHEAACNYMAQSISWLWL